MYRAYEEARRGHDEGVYDGDQVNGDGSEANLRAKDFLLQGDSRDELIYCQAGDE